MAGFSPLQEGQIMIEGYKTSANTQIIMHDEAYQQAISVESALKRPATLWLSMLSPVGL